MSTVKTGQIWSRPAACFWLRPGACGHRAARRPSGGCWKQASAFGGAELSERHLGCMARRPATPAPAALHLHRSLARERRRPCCAPPAAHPELRRWPSSSTPNGGLLPGVHCLAFEDGRVLLTLYVGDAQEMLRQQAPTADLVYLDGFSPPSTPTSGAPTPAVRAAAGARSWPPDHCPRRARCAGRVRF